MLASLRSLWSKAPRSPDLAVAAEPPPEVISIEGLPPFVVHDYLRDSGGFPALDWEAVHTWASSGKSDSIANLGWTACGRGWLEHLGAHLGGQYRLDEGETARVLSSQTPNEARAILDFMEKTPPRIVRVLEGIAELAPWGKDALVVFDDAEVYYRYVSRVYPDGEFGFSSGMHIREGSCSYFVTTKAELAGIEPVIAHEMTHACLGHLPIPAWLNEGLAVNTERRLTPRPSSNITPHQMHRMHCRFWDDEGIQEFWSGKSFLRSDDGQMLSYDLAAILVAQLSRNWASFRLFVLEASLDDGGASASLRHFDVDLGAAVCALVERDPKPGWSPDPARWQQSPERGAFG